MARNENLRLLVEPLLWFQAQPEWLQELLQRPGYEDRVAAERRAEMDALDIEADQAKSRLRAAWMGHIVSGY